MELALVENLQREDLNPLETAAAYQALMEGFGLSKEKLALRLGKSRAAVTNTLRLVQLPTEIQAMVLEGKLTEGHARAILGLENEDQMLRLAQRVHLERLSVRKAEQLVREHATTPQEQPQETTETSRPEVPDEFEHASRIMQEALELPVKVRPYRKGGRVEIRFRERDQLEALLALISARDDHSS
jgi:ParB family chromosome partitioning protein